MTENTVKIRIASLAVAYMVVVALGLYLLEGSVFEKRPTSGHLTAFYFTFFVPIIYLSQFQRNRIIDWNHLFFIFLLPFSFFLLFGLRTLVFYKYIVPILLATALSVLCVWVVKKWRRPFYNILCFLLFTGFCLAVPTYKRNVISKKTYDSIGKMLPTVTINQVKNTADAFEAVTNKKIAVIECWATWCKPCIGLLPAFERLYQENSDTSNVSYITLTSTSAGVESRQRINKFIDRKKYVFPVYDNPNGTLLDSLEINSIPLTIVTKNGKIEQLFIGATSHELYINKIKSTVDSLTNTL